MAAVSHVVPQGILAYVPKLVANALHQIPFVLFGVLWHRVVLESVRVEVSRCMTWSTAHWVFLVYSVATAVLFPLTFAHRDGNLVFLAFVMMIAFFYIEARISLLLPSTAIGAGSSLARAWRLSHGNGWKILLLALGGGALCWVITLPLWLPVALYFEEITAAGPAAQLGRTAFMKTLFFFSTAMGVATLSLAYTDLTGHERPGKKW